MKRYENYITIPSTVSPKMPESWTAKKLKFVLSYSKGKQPSQLTEEPVGDPYATMDYLRGRDCILQYPESTEGLVHIDNDSLLVLWDGANAGEFLRGKAGYLGSTMAVVEAGEKMDKSYLYYLLKGSEALSKMIAGGTTIPHFSPSFFDEIFAIPSLDDQQKIATFLDYKTGKIDRLTEMLTTRIDDLKKYRQSVISESITRGLNTSAEMKDWGKDWIGEIPSSWEVKKLKFICSVTDGTHFSPKTCTEGKPYITVSNVNKDKIDIHGASLISLDDFALLVKQGCQPKRGDVLLSKDGTVGRTAIVSDDNDFVCLSSLGILSPSPVLDSRYLKFALDSAYMQEQMLCAMAGSALRRITISKINEFIILLPSLGEQKQIADYIAKKNVQIDDTIAATEQQIKDLQAYRLSLISEAVTGQIDVRDWTAPEE